MQRMADDIERLFSDVDFARVGYGMQSPQRGTGLFDPWRSESRLADATWAPQVETFRREGKLVVRADLPGLTKDDIDIEIDEDVLVISGERSDETRDERDDFYRSERTYGRFFRAVQLPDGVDSDKIDATFKDDKESPGQDSLKLIGRAVAGIQGRPTDDRPPIGSHHCEPV
jgi:HSP20 family protein